MKKQLKVWLAVGLLAFASAGAVSVRAQQPAGDTGLGLTNEDEDRPREAPRPPIARKSDPSPPLLLNFLTFVIIVAVVFGANMMPSKRGHQD